MPESPYQLTVRVVLNPAVPAEAGAAGKYRWDRILLVVGLVAISLGLLAWLNRSPEPAAPTVAAVAPEPATGAPSTRPEAVPVSETQSPAGVPAPSPADDNDTSQSRVEATGQSPAEDTFQVPVEVAIQSPEGQQSGEPPVALPAEPVARPAAEAAVEAVPAAVAVPASRSAQVPAASSPAGSQASAGAGLRNPPVAGGSTRIISGDVRRFLITDRVEAKEPVGDISDIKEDRKVKGLVKVIAYSDVAGRAGDFLEYRWIRGDRLVARVPVGVGSDSWRSYTSKFLNKDMRGSWRVELRTRGGELLAETAFEY